MENEKVGSECRFAIHIPSYKSDIPDIHIVKEQVHYSNGDIKPSLRFIKDFKRDFYITKKNKRNHVQKKECEEIDNLLRIETTQSELRYNISKALDKQWSKDSIKQLFNSPYIYGAEISSTAIIKKRYMDKYPNLISPYTVATFDVETDVVNGTKEIIIATIIFKDKIFTAVLKDFVKGFALVQDLFKTKVIKYIGEYIEKYNMSIELFIADNVVDLIKAVFNKAHEWKPDFLSIWNMDYDIPQVLRILEENNVNPKDILCDPSIPPDLRICKYKQGSKKQVTSSGVVKPINPASQWHTLINTSSFYVIDAMCVYKRIRLAKQEEPSYSLDAILNKELGIRKLKFEEADKYNGIRWHQFMQTEFKIEYIVYNIFDCLSMIELDNKTKDLSHTIGTYSEISDFKDFKSQPKRIADALHFYFLENNNVIGTVGYDNKKDIQEDIEQEEIIIEEDTKDETLGLKGWIVTLPAHLTIHGLNCIEEDITIRTGIRAYVFDSDATAAYPTCISTANVSKSTTKREVIDISNINKDVFKMQNLNVLLGPTNALEYGTIMFNLPKPVDLLEMFINN